MQTSASTSSAEADDSEILELLLKISDTRPQGWEPQFPFLDPPTVSCLSRSVSETITKGKHDLRKQMIPLLRKWCTGTGKPDLLCHSTWMGRSLSLKECVESTVAVCIPLLMNECDWNKRDPEQQLAISYALLGAATTSPSPLHSKAGDLCVLLVDRISTRKNLGILQHRFLAQVWSCVGEIPIKSETLIRMVERSFLGIEMMLLSMGKRAVHSNNQVIAEFFNTVVGSIFLSICSKSTSIFQNVCKILTHMMAVTDAHPGIQAFIKAFIRGVELECRKSDFDISALYEEPCQLLSALLCVEPSLLPDDGKEVLSRQFILKMLDGLPRKKAACLLSQRPIWLLYTI